MIMNLLADVDIGKLLGLALRTSIGVQAATFALAAVGLNLHYGYTGLLNFGVVAFMAAGAYGMAIFFTQGWLGGSLILAIAAGLVFAVGIALSIGLPSLRLRADYLAITTIAIAEVLRISFRSQRLLDLTGGPFGLPSIEDRNANVSFADVVTVDWNPISDGSYGFWRLRFDDQTLWVMILGWMMVLLATLLIWGLMRSPWGRVIKAIREDEDAARALGKNVFSYKLQSLIIGGMIAALAGVTRALNTGFVETQQFRPQTTFFIWTVLILGGAASVWGPVVGSIAFWFVIIFVEELLRQMVDSGWIPEAILKSNDIASVRMIMMGLMLGALMIWRPQGLVGKKEEAQIDVR
ncbi:MAG: branched-chain amino acid ABC transporter permease [Acidimicrobiales bacterium]|jgi:neutral amino acid transport system permease protein|nr:branched-chain amino acid ABC transporter permease [Acidimicrobiales bacterium]